MDPVATVLLRRLGRAFPPPGAAGMPGPGAARVVAPPGPDTAPGGADLPGAVAGAAPDGAAWAATVEADLAARGWVPHRDLRAAMSRALPGERDRWAGWLLATLDALVGADRDLTPLYRSFPDTPDIATMFVKRLLTHLFATEGAPCVLCGRDGVGAPLDPCGHLVCRDCFPPAEFSGCPICGLRLAAGSGYLPLSPEPDPGVPGPALRVQVLRLDADPAASAIEARDRIAARPHALSAAERDDLRTLVAATAPDDLSWLPAAPARETLAVLIAWALHATAGSPAQSTVIEQARRRWGTATDVARTLWAYSGGDPGLILPPVADRRGRTLGGPAGRAGLGFAAPADRAGRAAVEPSGWRPAGPDAGRPGPPVMPVARVRALPRPLRRAVLAHLDGCGAASAAEDLRRHPTVWKRLGERLHPFEQVAAHPEAAVAFAVLRGTRTGPDSALGRAIVAAARRHPRRLTVTEHPDGRIGARIRTHAAEVEAALARNDVPGAARLLTERPGLLWRRLDHLLRSAGRDAAALAAVTAAARATAHAAAPGLIATASAELAGRDRTVRVSAPAVPVGAVGQAISAAVAAEPPRSLAARLLREAASRLAGTTAPAADPSWTAPAPGTPRRLFFPAGDVGRTWTAAERRAPLPGGAITAIRGVADAELAGRAARLGRFDLAVIDATLIDVPTPLRARVSSGALAGWPRGSRRDLPAGDRMRFYLHWTDVAGHRVDLDLSCVFFDEHWRKVGHCDYTRLRFAGDAAVHSGDFTSAPPPAGATEYLDLNLPALRGAGARYLAPVVFSYNDVSFELLTEAFAGFAVPWPKGRLFDASRVVQRFDLRGNARALLPMVIDAADRRLVWTDVSLSARGAGHDVDGHAVQLARAAADQWEYFAARPRPTLLDLAAWHAAGRAERIVLAFPDGGYATLPDGVAPTAAAIRALADAPRDHGPRDATGRTVLAAVVDADTLGGYVPGHPAEGSLALTVTGRPDEPWQAADAAELLGALGPR
ncbi:MXAN_6230/SCO0854 family RING domain-containing protein [Actinoplanes teichomyceticus]|uniref:RING finger family protein n=1 Tax=Actinoplanes teichomyceticus TaxID=1867 RepID=A0A561VSL6_ACTTI|nr:MXAN_6230/SCO0854 family RING domain-containing protein [Actinoplanes teichomyceticus]TWG14614.1 RING finger family protein [Actinoplanes teichomyceticus]GIF10017.1 hypothetical protein Ate01nite_00490 [Actinoplanes teichomyceticus]